MEGKHEGPVQDASVKKLIQKVNTLLANHSITTIKQIYNIAIITSHKYIQKPQNNGN